MSWKSDYTLAPDHSAASLSDEEIQHEKIRRYSKKCMSKRDLAFLLVPSMISFGTLIALMLLAGPLSKGYGANFTHGTSHGDPLTTLQDHQHAHEIQVPGVTHCGGTAEEAKRLGCLFDTVSFSWLAPACFDQELFEEFDKLEVKFPFYYDPEGKSEAPWSEVVKGERAMYVPWSHHLWHCGFLWRKMHRAIIAGTPVDSYIGNYTHTEHCTHIMVEENRQHSMEDVNTIMALKFPYCGKGDDQWFGGTNFTRA